MGWATTTDDLETHSSRPTDLFGLATVEASWVAIGMPLKPPTTSSYRKSALSAPGRLRFSSPLISGYDAVDYGGAHPDLDGGAYLRRT
jgi:hypothetical protein